MGGGVGYHIFYYLGGWVDERSTPCTLGKMKIMDGSLFVRISEKSIHSLC